MIIKIINKKAMINGDDNQTDHHNRIAMFCRFGIRLPPAASAQCAFAVCSSFLIGAATTGMMVMMVMMNTILMVVVISIMSNYTASAKVT